MNRCCSARAWSWQVLAVVTVSPISAVPARGQTPASFAPATAPIALGFDNVTVVDVEHGMLASGQRVVIIGNRIKAVGSRRSVSMPKGAQVIDGSGKYLIPGLWDMHVHPEPVDFSFPLLLANGATGIRDANVMLLGSAIQWRRQVLAGVRIGPPRQILSSRVYGAGPMCRFTPPCVTGPVRARQLVDSLKAAGADMIKMYEFGARQWYLATAAAARRAGIPFGGHVAAGSLTPIEAANSGAHIVDHIADFSASAGSLGPLCFFPSATLARCRSVAEAFKRHDTWWVPTLTIMGAVRKGFPNLYEVPYQPVADTIATHFFDTFAARFREIVNGPPIGMDTVPDSVLLHLRYPLDSTSADRLRALLRARQTQSTDSRGMLRFVRRLGLPLLAGTDASQNIFLSLPLGFTLHVELALYVAEGLTPLEALQTATLNPAKALHATDSLGTVAAGKLADLVLLDADPLADITNTQRIRAVVANGRYFDRVALDTQLIAGYRALSKFQQEGQAYSDLLLQYGPHWPVLLKP